MITFEFDKKDVYRRFITFNNNFSLFGIDLDISNDIAKRDGFDNYFVMLNQFEKMYGKKLWNIVFTVIRWQP